MADDPALDPGVPILAETALADRVDRPAPVLVLFYADWCPFCEAFVPGFREANAEASLPAVAANVSHPEDPRWETYSVEAIPTVLAYREGAEIDRLEAVPGEGLTGDVYRGFLDRLDGTLA